MKMGQMSIPKSFNIDNTIRFLLDFSSSAIFTAVASLFFWQWELSSLAVETSSGSGNSITGSGNALCILFLTNNRDWDGLMSKRMGLGYRFTKKACFVCGSFSHLIRDYVFHEKRMAKQIELNKQKGKSTGPKENRPVWNNMQRLNHQNKFVPTAVLTADFQLMLLDKILLAKQHQLDNPHQTLKGKGIVDSGCSKHMTGNKAYLVDNHDFNGGPVAFGDSKGQITGKGRTRFSLVFFLRTKDETSGILKDFIRQIKNQLNQKVKTIRCDNGTEFKNSDIIEFCRSKGIKREYSNARTPQQNGLVERKNKTLIEAARTMLSLKAKNEDEKLNEDTDSKNNEELVDQAGQAFLEELERLKRQEKEATDAAETLRKTDGIFTSASYDDEGAARASSTNFVNTATTPVNAASTPTNQDASQIPALKDIYMTIQGMGSLQVHLMMMKNVWILVDLPFGKKVIGTKWVYMNKKDERGVVVRNKARLVAQGQRQEEWIDYDEVFAPVSRIEAIKIFLAFASYMGFIVYQMDVKSAFLYSKIDEEVGGLIDKTLFIKKDKKDIMLVQVYVDDIIFSSIMKSWCDEFEALMKNRFQISSMGKLTFFLGLQVKQKEDGIFISQDKYVAKILKKFHFLSVKTASTPIETKKPLVKDEEVADMDVTPKTLHLQAVKRIFRYLKDQPKLGLWYPRDSPFDLEAYSDSDYARENLDRKSTT
nr:hypothetical protein [Tanacetum cinerariifolium]